MGSTIDKWVDGTREFVYKVFDFLPNWAIKTIKVLWYIAYAAIVIFIFIRFTD